MLTLGVRALPPVVLLEAGLRLEDRAARVATQFRVRGKVVLQVDIQLNTRETHEAQTCL